MFVTLLVASHVGVTSCGKSVEHIIEFIITIITIIIICIIVVKKDNIYDNSELVLLVSEYKKNGGLFLCPMCSRT